MLRSALPKTAPLLLCAAVLLGGCQSAETDSADTDQSQSGLTLTGAGSTFAAPIINAWISAYTEQDETVGISYDSVGSGEGIRRFLEGSVDFGATDAPVSAEQLASAEGAHQLPLTAGMIGITYNMPQITEPLKLSREAYVGIFDGTIDRWDDPLIAANNPQIDLPAKLIQIVARSDSSGTTHSFSEHLASVSPDWASGAGVGKRINWIGGTMEANGNEGLAGRVKLTLGSIGYVEAGFADRLGLPMALLENQHGEFVGPTIDAGQAAMDSANSSDVAEIAAAMIDPAGEGSYPLTTYTWFLVRGDDADPEKDEATRTLINWILTEGQTQSENLRYIPLSDKVTSSALAELDLD